MVRPLWSHERATNLKCNMPNFLRTCTFLKTSLSDNRSDFAGRLCYMGFVTLNVHCHNWAVKSPSHNSNNWNVWFSTNRMLCALNIHILLLVQNSENIFSKNTEIPSLQPHEACTV